MVAAFMADKVKSGCKKGYMRGIESAVKWWHDIKGYPFRKGHPLVQRVKQSAPANASKTDIVKYTMPFTLEQIRALYLQNISHKKWLFAMCAVGILLAIITGLRGGSIFYHKFSRNILKGHQTIKQLVTLGIQEHQINVIFKKPDGSGLSFMGLRLLKYIGDQIDTNVIGIRITLTGEEVKNLKPGQILYKYIGRTRNISLDPVYDLLIYLQKMHQLHGYDGNRYIIRLPNNKPVTIKQAREWIKIARISLPNLYNYGLSYHLHSARGTTADRLYKLGFSTLHIAKYGDWSVSTSLAHYIPLDISTALKLADRILWEPTPSDKIGVYFDTTIFNKSKRYQYKYQQ